MLFVKRPPSAALTRFVEYLWLVKDAPPHARERILPTGTLELVVNLDRDQIRIYDLTGRPQQFSGTVISGAYDRAFDIDTTMHSLLMGVHFRPGGAFPFTRVAPGELANTHIDATLLWGPRAAQLRERLCCACTHQERFDILDRTLVAQAADGSGIGPRSDISGALDRLTRPRTRVSDLVSSLGVSHRHFAASFREQVGMAPKMFARIQRFQRAIALGREGALGGCAMLSLECGYFDQAHMNRDFAAFARITPREMLDRGDGGTKDFHLALR